MECERLKKLVKNWYLQVQDESMAPARMVDFMRNHVADCSTCMADPLIEIEVKRIIAIVLPAAKIPKAIRQDKDQVLDDDDSADIPSAESEDEDETDLESDVDDEDEEEEVDPDDEI
jgi:hypothetical protein